MIGTFLLNNALDTSSLNYKTMKKEYHKVLLILWLNVIAIPVYTNKKTVRKVKVTLNPMYRIFLNFGKSCILSCLSKFYNKKKIQCAVFEI